MGVCNFMPFWFHYEWKKTEKPLEIVNFPVSRIWFFISHERMTLYSAIIFIDVSK